MMPAHVAVEGARQIEDLHKVREHASSLLEALATGRFSVTGALNIEYDQHGRIGRKNSYHNLLRDEALVILRMKIEAARKREAEIIRRLNQLEIEVPKNPFAVFDLHSTNMIAGRKKSAP